ncbi:hypothetical protein ABZ942_14920 [Nocardia sp. NPDC046473]|uniref:DUF6414 family protein n=1 Tax=Nocardia sp. NPDC046473 TaxID=3155733 RepID=UPI0033F7FC0D
MDVLREYLYVDLEKVKGLASQLYEGIPEATEESRKTTGRTQLGSRYVGLISKDRESDVMDRKLIVDALFPAIERDLEAEGYLQDVSDTVSVAENYGSLIVDDCPPGSIVRITSQGRIVDPRYFARTMVGFATAVNGFTLLDPETPRQSGKSRPKGQPSRASSVDETEGIPDLPQGFFGDGGGITSSTIRGMVKVMRGIYPPAVSMILSPAGVEGPSISIRLEEGRQHLDAEPETLFARYGLGLQEWTVVGMIGYHAVAPEGAIVTDVLDEDKRINRGKLITMVNNFLDSMSGHGLVEMPQAPGFSVVPLAVYRVIPRSSESRALEGRDG